MAVTYGFYDSLNGDRKYNAVQISSMFDGLIQDGVFATIGTALVVVEYQNMSVMVGEGKAWFNHTWTVNSDELVLTLDASEPILDRIDAIILEVDATSAVRTNSIKIVKGTPSETPVNPTMENTATKHQYPLAYILVGAGVTAITTPDITNAVGTVECPFVVGLLEGIDVSTLIAQWAGDLADMLDANQAEFDAWFNNLVDQLTGEQVTNLQNQINTINAGIPTRDKGWIPLPLTWTPGTIDGVEGNISAVGNVCDKISAGMRLQYEQEKDLTEYWPMTADFNGIINGINGVNSGVEFSTLLKKFDPSSALFDGGNDVVTFADNISLLKPTGDFTLGGWLNKQTTGSNQDLFWSRSIGANIAGFSIQLVGSQGRTVRVTIGKNTGSVVDVDYTVLDSESQIKYQDYSYIVVTLKGTTLNIYIDGKLAGSKTSFLPAYGATTEHRFSNSNGTNALYVSLQDVFFINGTALSAFDIFKKYLENSPQSSADVAVKKFSIVSQMPSWDGTNSEITFLSQKNHELENLPIINPYFSTVKVPYGFDPDDDLWNVQLVDIIDQVATSPAASTWIPKLSLEIPRGLWRISYDIQLSVQKATITSVNARATLSLTNNGETNKEMTGGILITAGSATLATASNIHRETIMRFAQKTVVYLNVYTPVATVANITLNGSISPSIIKAEPVYL